MNSRTLKLAIVAVAFLLADLLAAGCGGGGMNCNGSGGGGGGGGKNQPSIVITDRDTNRLISVDNINGDHWQQLIGKPGPPIHPTAIALDARGRIYFADRGAGQIVRMDDLSGNGYTTFGSPGSGVNQFLNPVDICLDAQGRIYVADQGDRANNVNGRIVRIDDMKGTNWKEFNASPTGVNGEFLQAPSSVCVDGKGRIYAADGSDVVRVDDMQGNGWTIYRDPHVAGTLAGVYALRVDAGGRIYILYGGTVQPSMRWLVRLDDMMGSPLAQGKNRVEYGRVQGQTGFPTGRSMALAPNGQIYISDATDAGSQIERIDDMTAAGRVAFKGFSPPFQSPSVALGPDGAIYAATEQDVLLDMNAGNIARFTDMQGAHWLTFSNIPTSPFADPGSVVSRPGGAIYMVDASHHRIVLMNSIQGDGWSELGTQGSGNNQFSFPEGICLGSTADAPNNSKIFVADSGNNRIVQMDDIAGHGWVTLGSQGSGTKQFNLPTSVFVDQQHHVYVADTLNNRIVRMDDMTGTNWKTLTASPDGSQSLSAPHGVCVDHQGRIYIADGGNHRIVRVDDMTGKNWMTRGARGSGTNQFQQPISIIGDTQGNFYVTDSGNQRLVKLDAIDGNQWAVLGTQGNSVGQFQNPFGVGVTNPEMGPAAVAMPDFTLGVNPPSLQVVQSESVNVTVSVTGQTGFNGQVALTVSGLPNGVTGTFKQSNIAAGATTTLTLNASGPAAATSTPVTVTVTGTSGALTHFATFQLNVIPPNTSSPTGQIVFSSSQDPRSGKAAIMIIDRRGQHLRPLTDGMSQDTNPRFSPDGKSIVFNRTSTIGAHQIWMIQTDGSGLAQITPAGIIGTEDNTSPTFTADGSQILFITASRGSLAIMNLDGSNAHYLGGTMVEIDQVSASPDGKTLALAGRVSLAETFTSIYLLNLDGTNLRKLPNPTGVSVAGPRFSSDGSTLVFYTNTASSGGIYQQSSDVYTMTTTGTNPKKLTNDTKSGWPTFLIENADPTETSYNFIIFATWRNGPTEIALMDSGGGGFTPLTQSAAGTANQSPDTR